MKKINVIRLLEASFALCTCRVSFFLCYASSGGSRRQLVNEQATGTRIEASGPAGKEGEREALRESLI